MIQVCLKADLVGIIRNYFQQEGVNFTDFGDAVRTAALYCEVNTRRIAPRPRRVRLSNEIHGTLGRLAHEADPSKAQKAQAAWRTVFRLRQKFSDGEDVTPYLSKGILNRPEEPDGLLWDYGLHHLHLNEGLEVSGYIQRSDYLLFVVVTEDDAFFVDVRLHRDPKDLQWVRQDLPQMIHSNWPQLMEGLSVEGVTETTVSDKEKKELRRKNVNVLHQVGGQVLFPLGRGNNGGWQQCPLPAMGLQLAGGTGKA